jgi:hypothetical protein
MAQSIGSIAIIGAQAIGDGIGDSDADAMMGGFTDIFERFIASNWKNYGRPFMDRNKKLGNNGGYHMSELCLDYPDADATAKRFVTELGLIP